MVLWFPRNGSEHVTNSKLFPACHAIYSMLSSEVPEFCAEESIEPPLCIVAAYCLLLVYNLRCSIDPSAQPDKAPRYGTPADKL